MRPLGDLFDIGAGKTMSAAARAGGDKVPFLRTSNVFWDRLDLTSLDEMAISDAELHEKNLLPGDLLVCEGGEIGRAAIWDGSIDRISFQNHLHRLRPKPEMVGQVDPRFYVFYLQSGFTQLGIFEGIGNKTTIPNLSRNQLSALQVPFPPLEEQQKVVAVLGALREAVGVQERLADAVERLYASALRDLFTLGLRGEQTEESEIGPIPSSWRVSSIRELCQIWSGGTPRKAIAEFWSGDIPWVSGKDLKRPVLDDATDHLSTTGVETGSRLAPEDAVLLLVRGMGLARDLPVATLSRPMAFNQDVKALVIKDEFGYLSGHFLRSAIYAGKARLLSQIVASAHGTMTLNLNDVEGFQIAHPTNPDEASEIDRTIQAIERKADLHRTKLAGLQELFQRLLRDLMTGEVAPDQLLTPANDHGSSAA